MIESNETKCAKCTEENGPTKPNAPKATSRDCNYCGAPTFVKVHYSDGRTDFIPARKLGIVPQK